MKNVPFNLRVTEEEKELFVLAAAGAGLTLSAWVRGVLLRASRPMVLPVHTKAEVEAITGLPKGSIDRKLRAKKVAKTDATPFDDLPGDSLDKVVGVAVENSRPDGDGHVVRMALKWQCKCGQSNFGVTCTRCKVERP